MQEIVLCRNYKRNQRVKAKIWVKRRSLSYAQDRVLQCVSKTRRGETKLLDPQIG
jgi:hypothetical protein